MFLIKVVLIKEKACNGHENSIGDLEMKVIGYCSYDTALQKEQEFGSILQKRT